MTKKWMRRTGVGRLKMRLGCDGDGEGTTMRIYGLQDAQELENKIKQLDFFPGTVPEYSGLKGRKFEEMDVELGKKYVAATVNSLTIAQWDRLLLNGCTALCRYDSKWNVGIPVRGTWEPVA